jgi:hypothetical protein
MPGVDERIEDLRLRIASERLRNNGVLKYSNELQLVVVNFVSNMMDRNFTDDARKENVAIKIRFE